ncbi:hypothetical protein DPEC_G00224000 [Dallia pectoralis]|uniref:Uncharacterized protein n=1 Tax=Dallia pectoralis TaxID=75939 RepID=A0ACC2G0E7_DALPE|nr:hypothetical protein DPEC_G00224000 [Dallia pectoralis]
MTTKESEDMAPSVPLCVSGAAQTNGTCMVQTHRFFPPFSSTFALMVLVAMIIGTVLVSLAAFHFNKRRMKKRKIQRAQEEYERDTRSPSAKRERVRPCVIVRRSHRDEEHRPNQNVQTPRCPIQEDPGTLRMGQDTTELDPAHTGQGHGHVPETIVSS